MNCKIRIYKSQNYNPDTFSIIMKKHIVAIFLFAASLSVSSGCKTHQNMPFWTKLALGKIGADYGDSVRQYLIGNKQDSVF